MRAAVALGLAACAGGDAEPQAQPLAGGWIAAVVRDPAQFTATVEADGARLAWAALHRGAYGEALDAPGVTGWRGATASARYAGDLAALSSEAWPRLAAAWSDDPGLPRGTALPLLAAWAVGEADPDARDAWLDRLDGSASPTVSALADATRGGAAPPAALDPTAPLVRCLAVRAGQPTTPEALAPCVGPVVEEATEEGGARRLYDPLLAEARRDLALRLASERPSPPPESLAATLFSSQWGACPVPTDEAGWCPPHAQALGQRPLTGGEDDADVARAQVRALDDALEAVEAELRAEASPEAVELLDGLQLFGAFRARFLADRARVSLAEGRPRQALAFAQGARDLAEARRVGPTNPPEAFALSALALVRAGRTREALDPLRALVEANPTVAGLFETLGDLSVLETMHRTGDSKER